MGISTMRTLMTTLTCCLFLFVSIQSQEKNLTTVNPFQTEYRTPFQTPPFDLIKIEHYMPAFREGMKQELNEIDAIVNNPQMPNFENTIEALARTGALLEKVDNVFSALRGANNNDDLQKIAVEVSPLESKHNDDINMNEKLFLRVKAVYDQKDKLGLNAEQTRLLEHTYKGFVRGGANLSPEKKERFRKINEELSMLSLKFNDNVLKETNSFKMVVEKKEDLEGLPQSSIDAAAALGKEEKLDGKWIFTTRKPSMLPFLTYAKNRSLRETLYKGYIHRGDNNNEYDNKKIIARIASLRVERSNLLGYKTYADFRLEINMAKTPRAVYDLLNKVWTPAIKVAKKERDDMQVIIDKEGGKFKLASWDWWYYAEKVRKERYDLDENELRPYFQMENVRKGVFDVASKLYGIQFIERKDIPKYLDEVTVFEVKRNDGSHVGILYTDYFPRSGKRAGAWCGGFRRQKRLEGKNIAPVIYNVGNFSRPTNGQPALLSLDEVETLFHEFGHAVQGLLSNITYPGLPMARDFVELPSQIMEHWALEPEVLRTYAFHYKTGEVIPQILVDKITKSSKFNQGFATVEYLAASFLDMDWHSLTSTEPVDVVAFENQSLGKIGLMPEIISRYRSTYFSHIIGGYEAGYYSYLWAEVLDSDAFEAFKEKGIFDQATAQSFMKNILERGGSDDPMTLYVKFRGKQPTIEPLLKKRGLM
jgi:peptidyl-dipeptidase Dcp